MAHETLRSIDERQAFEAMRAFLEAYWERGLRESDDIGGLLGGLSTDLWADGMPADPAMWQDWREAVDKACAASRSLIPEKEQKPNT